jgi:Putative zinc ribbon domain
MPLSADPKGGGTEANGDVSTRYCSFCYQNGAFTDQGATLPEFTEKLKAIMSSMNMPADVSSSTIAMLSTLDRWRS